MLDGIPKDLREMDEKQFVEVFDLLRDKTKDWTKFTPELLIENNQFLFIIRCALNLSQRELAKELGCSRDWIRHTEAGRNIIIHKGPASRWTPKITKLLKSKEIALEDSLLSWLSFRVAKGKNISLEQNKPKTFWEIEEVEIADLFNNVVINTNNFKNFDPLILFKNPRNILIFRLILGLGHKEFARFVECGFRSVRRWERLEGTLKKETAIKVISKIKEGIENLEQLPSLNQALLNFRTFRNLFGNRNIKSNLENGLRLAKSQKLSSQELEIFKILKENSIQFKTHENLEGMKKIFNVDFLILNGGKSRTVIEAFTIRKNPNVHNNLKQRACILDHKFQMIKLRDPSIKTIICIHIDGKSASGKDFIEKTLELEVVNTDHILIDDIEKLPNLL